MAQRRAASGRMGSLLRSVPAVMVGALLLGTVPMQWPWESSPSQVGAQEVETAETQEVATAEPVAAPTYRPVLRPVTETVFDDVTNPRTGKVERTPRKITRMVTEYQPVAAATAAVTEQQQALEARFPHLLPRVPHGGAVTEQQQALETEAAKIAAELRRVKEPPERERLTEQLEQLLHKAFALQQQRWAQQIEQLKSQLDQLEQQRTERQQREDLIVQRRLSQLTSGVDPLAWKPAGPPTMVVPMQQPYGPPTMVVPMQQPYTATRMSKGDGVGRPGAVAILGDSTFADEARAVDRGDGETDVAIPGGSTFAEPSGLPSASSDRVADPVDERAKAPFVQPQSAAQRVQPDIDPAESADRLIQAAAAYLKAGEQRLVYERLGAKGAITQYEATQAETATEVAKVRFELAHRAFMGLKERLDLLYMAARRGLDTEQQQQQMAAALYEQGSLSQRQMVAAGQAEHNATLQVRRAELALRSWQEAAEATAPMVERAEQMSKRLAESKTPDEAPLEAPQLDRIEPTPESHSDGSE